MTNLWKRNPKDANSMHETQKTLSNMHQTVTHLTSHTVSHIPIQSVILIVSPSWARVQDFPFPHLSLYCFSTSPPHLASLVLPFSSLRPFGVLPSLSWLPHRGTTTWQLQYFLCSLQPKVPANTNILFCLTLLKSCLLCTWHH